ncbi:MAG: sensor histidine kinase [Acidimicrobiales bacterium]
MKTPSLAARVVAGGVSAVLVLLVGLDVLIYLSVRATMLDKLEVSLDSGETLARAASSTIAPDMLGARLAELDVMAVVRRPDGTTYEPANLNTGVPTVQREVRLADGNTVVLAVNRDETDKALNRLLELEITCTVLITVLGGMVLRWISEVALRPLDQIVTAAGRTAGGKRGERLVPNRPETRLGQMAVAYDQMLDSLESTEQAASRLASIVESSDDAIIGTDLDGRIFSWNRAAERIFGYLAEEAIGRDISMVVVPDRHEALGFLLGMARKGEAVPQHEMPGLRKDTTVIDIAMTTSPVRDENDEFTGASVIVRDVTADKRMAEALRATLGHLEVALREAKESEARTRQFLDDAAHQLRTPVAGIQACAETLLRGSGVDDRDRLLAAMVGETTRAGRLIKALLTMARLEHGQELTLRPCDLGDICWAEAARSQSLAPAIHVKVVTGPRPAQMPLLDASAVREILSNLVDNALRHSRSTITLTVSDAGDPVEVRVGDDGAGLSPRLAASAFERFVSLDGRGGTGLGLPIAQELARAHGGELTYEDRFFVLRFPGVGRAPATSLPVEEEAENLAAAEDDAAQSDQDEQPEDLRDGAVAAAGRPGGEVGARRLGHDAGETYRDLVRQALDGRDLRGGRELVDGAGSIGADLAADVARGSGAKAEEVGAQAQPGHQRQA